MPLRNPSPHRTSSPHRASSPRRRFFVLAAVAAAAALLLSACSATPATKSSDNANSSTTAFPVTLTHAFGKTTIESAPKRVVALGWGSADAAIALGVIPVAIPFQSYGGDKNGVLPWIAEALKEKGAPTPTVLPETAGDPPYEDIAKANPDLILASYSGITKAQYDLLTKIAPVVAYPKEAWSTPWREVITIAGKALGRSEQAAALLKTIDGRIADAAAAHPEFKGKTIAEVWDTGGKFYVYTKADPRVAFTLDLGFTSAPSVDALETDESPFYFTLSYEKLDELKSDVLVSFGSTQKESDAFLGAKYTQVMPQVKDGAVASPVGTQFIASVSPPTALSLTWGLDDYVALLSKAAKAADAAG